ncbi:MAG: methionine--tRNA ligase, partial [Planctomycetes bacterium]|nr:methionine--tRNA ligase [Planctomycetota bacterium]
FDDFIRTTQPRHTRAVKAMLERIYAAGDVFQGQYEGWYCNGCEAFKNAGDLVDGRCPDHKAAEPVWLEEKNWFFRLSAYGDFLLEHYRAHPEFVQPDIRRNELMALLEEGLKDISISRESASWGVPVPFDDEAVVYVWFDALINYVSGTGWPEDDARFDRYWPADLHLVGKDITRFHGVIWPAMLKAAGLPLPKQIFGHGFVNFGQDRMSKSLGTAIEPTALAERFGADAIRWYLMSEAGFGRDLEYGEDRLVARANADLANGLGNLVSRSVSMIVRYREGIVPVATGPSRMAAIVDEATKGYRAAMDRLDLKAAADFAIGIVQRANVLVDDTAPWSLAKDPARADELDGVLYDLAESCRAASVLLQPFMPKKMQALRAILGDVEATGEPRIEDAAFGLLPAGRKLEKPMPLFARLELPEAQAE